MIKAIYLQTRILVSDAVLRTTPRRTIALLGAACACACVATPVAADGPEKEAPWTSPPSSPATSPSNASNPAPTPAADLGTPTLADPALAPISAYEGIGSDLVVKNHLNDFGWSDAQVAAFLEGIRAALHGKPYPLDAKGEALYAAMGRRVSEEEEKKVQQEFAQPALLKKYLRDMRKKFKLQQTDSGLCYNVMAGRGGIRPRPQDTVVVSFSVAAFDAQTNLPQLSTRQLRVRVTDLLPGLAEGVQMLAPGAKAMFLLPPAISFGSGTWPAGVPAGTPLFFILELHDVIPAETAP